MRADHVVIKTLEKMFQNNNYQKGWQGCGSDFQLVPMDSWYDLADGETNDGGIFELSEVVQVIMSFVKKQDFLSTVLCLCLVRKSICGVFFDMDRSAPIWRNRKIVFHPNCGLLTDIMSMPNFQTWNMQITVEHLYITHKQMNILCRFSRVKLVDVSCTAVTLASFLNGLVTRVTQLYLKKCTFVRDEKDNGVKGFSCCPFIQKLTFKDNVGKNLLMGANIEAFLKLKSIHFKNKPTKDEVALLRKFDPVLEEIVVREYDSFTNFTLPKIQRLGMSKFVSLERFNTLFQLTLDELQESQLNGSICLESLQTLTFYNFVNLENPSCIRILISDLVSTFPKLRNLKIPETVINNSFGMINRDRPIDDLVGSLAPLPKNRTNITSITLMRSEKSVLTLLNILRMEFMTFIPHVEFKFEPLKKSTTKLDWNGLWSEEKQDYLVLLSKFSTCIERWDSIFIQRSSIDMMKKYLFLATSLKLTIPVYDWLEKLDYEFSDFKCFNMQLESIIQHRRKQLETYIGCINESENYLSRKSQAIIDRLEELKESLFTSDIYHPQISPLLCELGKCIRQMEREVIELGASLSTKLFRPQEWYDDEVVERAKEEQDDCLDVEFEIEEVEDLLDSEEEY